MLFFFFLMIRRPPRATQSRSSAASDVYKRQLPDALARGDRSGTRFSRDAPAYGERGAADRANGAGAHLRREVERRLSYSRVVRADAALGAATYLPRESVSLVAGDRRDSARQAPEASGRRLPAVDRPTGEAKR